ncbi:unnamed protein product [Owenia fusiformis]|uniref:Uncharacterized protein n=1 Tax=Owenia fusiformis TaxID=6347 RepID=A0A8J1TYF9_OWEFU|nr:unnamed protein product [Owenia fusiformis]
MASTRTVNKLLENVLRTFANEYKRGYSAVRRSNIIGRAAKATGYSGAAFYKILREDTELKSFLNEAKAVGNEREKLQATKRRRPFGSSAPVDEHGLDEKPLCSWSDQIIVDGPLTSTESHFKSGNVTIPRKKRKRRKKLQSDPTESHLQTVNEIIPKKRRKILPPGPRVRPPSERIKARKAQAEPEVNVPPPQDQHVEKEPQSLPPQAQNLEAELQGLPPEAQNVEIDLQASPQVHAGQPEVIDWYTGASVRNVILEGFKAGTFFTVKTLNKELKSRGICNISRTTLREALKADDFRFKRCGMNTFILLDESHIAAEAYPPQLFL